MSFWNKLFVGSGENKKNFLNDQPLHLPNYGYEELSRLDLTAFPLIEDFAIKLKKTGIFGTHLYFYSEHWGQLAAFPWWDNVEKDLPKYTSRDIPNGGLEGPYDDLEQGWQILIFEDETFVYILQGDDPMCTEFEKWLKVNREKYYSEWMRVIREFNTTA